MGEELLEYAEERVPHGAVTLDSETAKAETMALLPK
jgi:hypothetical protein